MRIAIIGSGISGNTCAWLLHARHEVVLFESERRPGGHTNTVDIQAFGNHYAVDTGFMVFNDRTYPNFIRLLRQLGIEGQPSDMSFSVRCDQTRWEYQGSSLNGLFAQRANLLRPRFYRMLRDILRFNAVASQLRDQLDDHVTLGQFLANESFGGDFVDRYLVPMTAAIWSARPDRIQEMPARFLFQFCHNHGLLQLNDRPKWQTIPGGARRYVQAMLAALPPKQLRVGTPVRSVTRDADQVIIDSGRDACESFDAVIFACHADQALKLLGAGATAEEQTVLAKFPYQQNLAILHTDSRVLPRRRAAWASWNYRVAADPAQPVSVTYDLNRLQNLGAPAPICVTLNDQHLVDPATILAEINYEHPVFGPGTLAAQQQQASLNGQRRTYFCGAYWGYGFHEDGVRSALAVCEHFGRTIDSWTAVSTEDSCDIAASSR